jgi:hypothetical protein
MEVEKKAVERIERGRESVHSGHRMASTWNAI